MVTQGWVAKKGGKIMVKSGDCGGGNGGIIANEEKNVIAMSEINKMSLLKKPRPLDLKKK